jgi:hypothetical protein
MENYGSVRNSRYCLLSTRVRGAVSRLVGPRICGPSAAKFSRDGQTFIERTPAGSPMVELGGEVEFTRPLNQGATFVHWLQHEIRKPNSRRNTPRCRRFPLPEGLIRPDRYANRGSQARSIGTNERRPSAILLSSPTPGRRLNPCHNRITVTSFGGHSFAAKPPLTL